MSATLDDLLIKKTSVGATKYSLKTNFGLSLEACPMLMPTEVKEAESTDYNDEHGIDSYNASTQKYKSFDATFKLVAVTTSPTASHTLVKNLLDYLNTGGSLHKIYCPWAGVGRTNCRFKSLGDFTQHMNKSNEFVVQFSITLTIEDPVTEVTESTDFPTERD